MSGDECNDLPEIEKNRLARIARNQAVLRALEVTQAAEQIASSIKAEQDAVAAAQAARLAAYKPSDGEIRRRSLRSAAKAAAEKLQAAAQGSDEAETSKSGNDAASSGSSDADSDVTDKMLGKKRTVSTEAAAAHSKRARRSISGPVQPQEHDYLPSEDDSSGSSTDEPDADLSDAEDEQQQQQELGQVDTKKSRKKQKHGRVDAPQPKHAASGRGPKQRQSAQQTGIRTGVQSGSVVAAAAAAPEAITGSASKPNAVPAAGAGPVDDDWELQLALQLSMQEDCMQSAADRNGQGKQRLQQCQEQQQEVEVSLLDSEDDFAEAHKPTAAAAASHKGSAAVRDKTTGTGKPMVSSSSKRFVSGEQHIQHADADGTTHQAEEQQQQQQPATKKGRKKKATASSGSKAGSKGKKLETAIVWSDDDLFDLFAAFGPGDAAVITKKQLLDQMESAGVAVEEGLVDRMFKYAKELVQQEQQLLSGAVAGDRISGGHEGLAYDEFLVLARNIP